MSKATALKNIMALVMLVACCNCPQNHQHHNKQNDKGGDDLCLIGPPADLAATAVSPTEIRLTWTDNYNSGRALIILRQGPGGTFNQVGLANESDTYYWDSGLDPGVTYNYRVLATDNGVDCYAEASATTSDLCVIGPPANLSATAVSPTKIKLTWTDGNYYGGARIIYRKQDGGSFAEIIRVDKSETSYTDWGLEPGTTYYYRIHAEDDDIACYSEASSTTYENDFSFTRVSSESPYAGQPSLAWTGSEFGVAWFDERDGNYEIYFRRVSASGTTIGDEVRITQDPGASWLPSLAWSGSEFGVAWADDRNGVLSYDAYFARISSEGAKIGDDARITTSGKTWLDIPLVWTGSEYAISFSDFRDYPGPEVYLARISASGARIGDDIRVSYNSDRSEFTSLAWSGSEYGVVWQDKSDGNREIHFGRVSGAGVRVGDEVRVSWNAADSEYPEVAWNGSEFAVFWEDNREGPEFFGNIMPSIFFARLSSSGFALGPETRISFSDSDSRYVDVVWTGSDYATCWQERGGELVFRRLSSTGSILGPQIIFAGEYSGGYFNPSLAWTGEGFAVAGQDNADYDEDIEIFWGRFSGTAP